MTVACARCRLRNEPVFRRVGPAELQFISGVRSSQTNVRAREHILRPNEVSGLFYTIYGGWAFSYRSLGTGERQIVDFLLPGDPVGLQSSMTGAAQHGVVAITDVTLCIFQAGCFKELFKTQAELSRGLVETLLLDEQRFERRLLLVGQQRSAQRVCYLMLELRDRLISRSMGDQDACEFPLTYEQMTDALGLSRSQLARSLAELRDRGWALIRNGMLLLRDPEAMAEFCGYDPPPAAPARTLI